MEELKFAKLGRQYGYEGVELERFVDKKMQEKQEREDRVREREIDKLKLEKEIELAKTGNEKTQHFEYS